MTLSELKQKARELGYTHIKTGGGYVPLAEWTPYGLDEKSADTWGYSGDLIIETGAIQDTGSKANNFDVCAGYWRLEKFNERYKNVSI